MELSTARPSQPSAGTRTLAGLGPRRQTDVAAARRPPASRQLRPWHIEDEARTPGAPTRELAGVKRRVDETNQRRNDLAEELDRTLLGWLETRGLPNAEAPLHSESPG